MVTTKVRESCLYTTGLGSDFAGVFGGVVVTQDFLDTLDLNGNSKTTLLSTVTAIYDVGCFFGAILAIIVGDRLGRKKSVLVGTTIMSIGAILQISAYSVAQMIVGRSVSLGVFFKSSTNLHSVS